MTKLEKIVLLLTFWTVRPTDKLLVWEKFTKDAPFDEHQVVFTIGQISLGQDKWLDWSALNAFRDSLTQSVAPSPQMAA